MKRPGWLARLVDTPGTVSFRRFEDVVRRAGEQSDAWAVRSDAELVEAIRHARTVPVGTKRPRRKGTGPSAEFLAGLREAMDRTLGLRPFDEQLLGTCALLDGCVVEMDTGEGKTLVGALAAAGQALAGRSVHVLSVNDYLAERDADWMAPFFDLLGIRVGWLGQHTPPGDRRSAYAGPIVYASVSEVGFDLLRDRFATSPDERVEPTFEVAIVDEADAVLIDEAMVPLVLAGSSEETGDDVALAAQLAAGLITDEHFSIDAEQANVTLTDAGLDLLESELGGVNLYAPDHVDTLVRINLALHAQQLVHRDVDYLVDDGRISLINSARGRVAHHQRWPDGLHAAVEAKEALAVTAPGVVLDTVTVQELLTNYTTVSGMSGTVVEIAEELTEFYTLRSGRIERHEPNARTDEPDRVLRTTEEKYDALIDEVSTRHRGGQPVLVGTHSVAESEDLAALLSGEGVPARVLNARNDAAEAGIIARAGERGAVTISTQMSGRGTDIRLGGPDQSDRTEVLARGGLAVISSGRHPTRRLDAQLRGRAGRQGDPGSSIMFDSLDSDLVRAHAADFQRNEIEWRGETMPSDQRRRLLDGAQRIAEGVRRDRHRSTWSYHRAITNQRARVLQHRGEVLDTDAALVRVRALITTAVDELVAATDGDAVAALLRRVTLFHLDDQWQAHLALLQEIRDGIHLRALGGQDPATEFHTIAIKEFGGFFDTVYAAVADLVAGLSPAQVGSGLDDLGLRRPSATWTYMIRDNPFGSSGDRAVRTLGRIWRSRVLRIE
ncbi:MAG: accessory Sec system translocase SecA2 [Propionibacteriaceae bacterium]